MFLFGQQSRLDFVHCRFIYFGISNENSHFFYIALIAIIVRKIVEWIDSETARKIIISH